MKNAGKACNNRLYRHIRTFEKIVKNYFVIYSKYDNFDDKYPDANMLMQMLLLGFRVREIPAVMHMRTEGVSMHSGLKPILYMFRMTFSVLAVWIREKILKMDEGKIHALEKYDK